MNSDGFYIVSTGRLLRERELCILKEDENKWEEQFLLFTLLK